MRPAAFSAILAASLVLPPSSRVAAAPPAGGSQAARPNAKTDAKFAARALAEHGQSLFDAGRFAEAVEVFAQADRLYHATTIVVALARSHAALGHWVDARAIFERAANEAVSADAPKVWREAQRSAKEEVEALDKRIPTVRVLVRGGSGRALRVSVDQREIHGYRPDLAIALDPGQHVVSVVPFEGVGKSRTVELREGDRATVEIELASVARGPAPIAPNPPPSEASPWRLPSYVCFGVGAAGLALGVGAGIATLNKAASLKAACPTGTCPTHAHDADIDAANAVGIASTAGFVLAAAGASAGAVLWFVKPSKGKAPVAASLGPGSLDVRGEF